MKKVLLVLTLLATLEKCYCRPWLKNFFIVYKLTKAFFSIAYTKKKKKKIRNEIHECDCFIFRFKVDIFISIKYKLIFRFYVKNFNSWLIFEIKFELNEEINPKK